MAMELPNKRSKKPHRKTRNGCFNCKRRKVKCDECRPSCASCISFGLPCSYAGDEPNGAAAASRPSAASTAQPLTLPRRGRGRPRKAWVVEQSPQPTTQPPVPPAALPTAAHSASPAASVQPTTAGGTDLDLNLTQAELLHQFIVDTGPSLANPDDPSDRIVQFWTRNAPRIGLSHPAVLQLCLSLAAFHLHHLAVKRGDSESNYRASAEHHFSVSLAKANQALSTINPSTCGAVYVSTMLVCFCAFAAGPAGSEDLLVCNVGDTAPNRWLPLARGARLLRQLFDPKDLFAGLVSPLGPNGDEPEDPRPMCEIEGFTRVDWIDPIDTLRSLVTSNQAPGHEACLSSFNSLAIVYEATFGDDDGRVKCPGHFKMVLVWLYIMDDDFVARVQKLDPIALLLLGYYAPLLKTLKRCWFLDGWPEHILSTLQSLVEEDHKTYLQWPIETIKLI